MNSLDHAHASSPPARATDPLEHAIVDVHHLRSDLAACGFTLGDLEIELTASPAVAVGVDRTHGDAQSLTPLMQRLDLTSAQRGLVAALQRAYEKEDMILRTGHRIGTIRVKVGLPPEVTIALVATGEPIPQREPVPAPTAPDPGPTMPDAPMSGPTLLAESAPAAPAPAVAPSAPVPTVASASVRPPPPPPPRSARLSDKAPPPPKGAPTQLGYAMHGTADVAPPPPPPPRPSSRPSARSAAVVPPPPPAQPALEPSVQAGAAPRPATTQPGPGVLPSAPQQLIVQQPPAAPLPIAQPQPPEAFASPPVAEPAIAEPVAPPPPDPAPEPPPPPEAQAAIAPGSWVYVTWTDGNRYPGQVIDANAGQFLIQFEDGAQHWIHESYIAPA